ncbi:DUF4920 domain-containing protein [Luteibaculum oceani]|uniref:DUF4920 domain-containing protein n=1 Tax=Luteibaculum oceani TaxID=1294296 RepID=A0A5C6UUQ3_9FLAO|nr:DUF4920 domain-containing protein [Luteibaculum oceani]TXC77112.1 DUF4920 domain-containing protein [Luteibaculum oceani]
MKYIIATLISLSSVFAFAQNGKFYGSEFDIVEATSVHEIPELLKDKETIAGVFQGEIVKTCAKKGCWMTISLKDGEDIRVTFKDYGFFVPTEGVTGKKVLFTGTAQKKVIDVDTQRHFAEDAGKSKKEINKISKDKLEITFVAYGVYIM